jgi:PAS domain S-box-containing protein
MIFVSSDRTDAGGDHMKTEEAVKQAQASMVLVQGAVIGALVYNLLQILNTKVYGFDPLLWQGFVGHSLLGAAAGLTVGFLVLKRIRAEEGLRVLNNELDYKVRQRTSELKAANDDLKYEISEKKHAERRLRQTLIRQNAILDNIPDMAWLKDKDGTFLAVNEPFAKASGISREKLLGKTDFDFWPKELAQRYIDDDEQVMKTRKRKSIEETLVHTEGKDVWIETIKSPIYDENGEVMGTTGISRDITERKLMAEDLRRRLED